MDQNILLLQIQDYFMVNMKKTKIMWNGTGLDTLKDCGMWSCGVCRMGNNYIFRSEGNGYTHKTCNGIIGLGLKSPTDGCSLDHVITEDQQLETADRFCCLEHKVRAGGGCSAIVTTDTGTRGASSGSCSRSWPAGTSPKAQSSQHACGVYSHIPANAGHQAMRNASASSAVTEPW